MNRRFFLPFVVLFYVHGTSSAIAASCSEFRSDMQSIQQQVRQVEYNRSSSGLDAVQQASRIVKASCLDQLSALDMTSFGFTPGASAMVTKLANQACQKLSQELSDKIKEVNQKATQGINSAINGASIPGVSPGTLNDAIKGGVGGAIQQATSVANPPSLTNKAADYVANTWDSLKNMIMP